ncbi:hypothetical protein HWV62_45160 [Athelia sp. TMB]|nr:hypothetical protein HWV62_45160 [Athelia sp. TMB]
MEREDSVMSDWVDNDASSESAEEWPEFTPEEWDSPGGWGTDDWSVPQESLPSEPPARDPSLPATRSYQQEMLEESLHRNLIIAMDTGSGKTLVAILRMKVEAEREAKKISWFFAPTVALCKQQKKAIMDALPVPVGLISGALEPNQWKDPALWRKTLEKHRIMVTTPQVLLDALRHGAIEANLDSSIRAPSLHLDELAKFVHRPVFKRVVYKYPDFPSVSPAHNVASLQAVVASMRIDDDPYVHSLRARLASMKEAGPDRTRVDQRLSKCISKCDTYTHKGLKDFARAADEICTDVGTWAANWYVETVLEKAKDAATPYQNLINAWQNKEKAYLLQNLARVNVVSVSGDSPEVVAAGLSDKTNKLIDSLVAEKSSTETVDEDYSGIIFVTRRDAVLALQQVLSRHPKTCHLFRVGCLIGNSESSYRHSFLDITRNIVLHEQDDVLREFRLGEKNLIVATAVAEEGIDIQACGSVVRWDLPVNMTSWAQSRGRARRQRSTFVLMFADHGAHDGLVKKWEDLEREMQASYNDTRTNAIPPGEDSQANVEDDYREFRVPETGALLTTDSAVSHLNHFCSVLPSASQASLVPLYDIDPPDLPEGWHAMENRPPILPYTGPWGATVTLPRVVQANLRFFTVPCEYSTKISAFRHVAFKAYRALYEAGLLNKNLLPLTSVIEPDLEEEVKALLQDVEKRAGTASVTLQVDPWTPDEQADVWFSTEIAIDSLPPLLMLSRAAVSRLSEDDSPTLYHPYRKDLKVRMRSMGSQPIEANQIQQAREYTRKIFWELYGSRMTWSESDFAYLFLPTEKDPDASIWDERRSWFNKVFGPEGQVLDPMETLLASADALGKRFNYPKNIHLIRERSSSVKNFRFIGWKTVRLSEKDEGAFRERYGLQPQESIPSPLLVVKRFPSRMNFLLRLPPQTGKHSIEDEIHLRPSSSTVLLLSATDTEYALLLPSILRFLTISMTVDSLRSKLLTPSLSRIPLSLLRTAITAPVAAAEFDYERLETLGDTVLKFTIGLQLLAEYPLWHEGYLTQKKDHSVSNSRLAKDAHKMRIYQWIIRDSFLAQKWKPKYLSHISKGRVSEAEKTKDSGTQQLSTKMLADVVEALIGASYLHGGFDLAVECCKFFDLGVKWDCVPRRVETILSRVEATVDFPTSLTDVERMLQYTFKRKLLLIEAITHASYQFDDRTVSYERMEFLGDSGNNLLKQILVLDMIVTDYLYHAPGKNYSPGHMHLRKSAVVNAHTLAFICLRCSADVDTSLPGPNGRGGISIRADTQKVYLWQCLLHSSPKILEELRHTEDRYIMNKDDIEAALFTDEIFPWAALTRLQAPKLFSDLIESLLGAIYLDSDGNFEVIRDVLRTIGIWPILEHIVRDNVDIFHPVSRIYKWAQQKAPEANVRFRFDRDKSANTITCILEIDDVAQFEMTIDYHGLASQNDAKFAVAELAIKELQLRERGEGGHN